MITLQKQPNGIITIKDDHGHKCNYMYYTKRDALRAFREDFGYTGKRVDVVTV